MSRRFAIAGLRAALAGALAGILVSALPVAAAAKPVTAAQPAAAAAAKPVVLEGEIQVEVADYPDRTSVTRHYLKTADGTRRELRFKSDPAHLGLISGARVRVKGSLYGSALVTESTTAAVQELAPAVSYAIGPQKVAVLLVNFQDKISQPQTVSAVQSLVFGQVNSFLLENSFQTLSISGNAFGWYTIPLSSTSCDIGSIKAYARSAASAAGVDLSPYTRFVYMFPNTSACAWAGYGMIGGSPTDAWINGYFDRRVVAHELGHNLGLRHAHGLNCSSSPIGSSCVSSEYGDPVDTMGWGLYGHFSAYQKEYLGWLNFNGTPPITTVQSTGTYSLAPYAAGSGTKALKILKSTDPMTGEKTWYYLEYRQPTGFDGVLAGTGNLTSGVGIRVASASGGASLLDMTTNSNTSSDYNDMLDSTLAVGRSFTDTAAGLTVTVTRADSTGATVDVVMNGGTQTCTRGKPSVVISPYQPSAVAPSTQVNYTVAITNTDSAACGAAVFNVARTVPTGWFGVLRNTSLTIGAGTAASTYLTVSSPTAAAGGTYGIGVSAANAASSQVGSASATYSVSAPTGGSLTESLWLANTVFTRSSTATPVVTVKKDGVVVANASVTFKLTKANGQTMNYTTTTASNGQAFWSYWIPATDPVGTYRFDITATSGGLSTAMTATITVQ